MITVDEKTEILRELSDRDVMAGLSNDTIIRNHLLVYGSISSLEAIRLYGITRLAAVIERLRHKVEPLMNITTEIVKGENRFGKKTHYAVYRLVET